MDVLRDNPELRPFVLSNVRPTGTIIGAGAYGSVEEVAIPGTICAAKKIHDVFLDRSEIQPSEILKTSLQFIKECKLMCTLRHTNIVQFFGVCFFPGSRLPALVMERLLTCLHNLLDPDTDPPLQTNAPLKPPFPLSLKCSVLHNVASGIAYLHHQSPPIIHRDLSARNILLNANMIAKVADMGMARIVPRIKMAASMTKAPGASVYMPPEATIPSASNDEKSKYDASIDVFSFGVITIFTISEVFPCDLLAPTYIDETSGLLVARSELQRRSEYMKKVATLLDGDHPLIQLIQLCLHNLPAYRQDIRKVLHLLDEAISQNGESENNELVRALQTQPRVEVMYYFSII